MSFLQLTDPELTDEVRRRYSLSPFWFLNDALDDAEIVRQLGDFRAHRVWGFVIHNRVGLPANFGWMSECLLHHMETAIREAERTGMTVYLYDEGMYPSGSAAGRVVERNSDYANRGLQLIPGCRADTWRSRVNVADDARLVGEYRLDDGTDAVVVDRRTHAWIRGLHYREEPPEGTDHSDRLEVTHPAGDILNPQAVRCFINESHDRYFARFGRWFGNTIAGVFTDEPGLLGRGASAKLRPGTLDFLHAARDDQGLDLFSDLPLLWADEGPQRDVFVRRYEAALAERLSEVYYRPIAAWCADHGVALVGHPADPDDLASLRHFQIPGQDLVLRRVLPGEPSGIEGAESTQAKAAASVMIHEGRRRNANEFCGAYGVDFTFDEMRRLAFWLIVRGCNLLMPHAFYYSVRGPRRTERPPDVGPHSPWWNRFGPFADLCTWLCRINTEGSPVCDVAVVAGPSSLPWKVARSLFENQVDFAYLGKSDLDRATVEEGGVVAVGDGRYRVLLSEKGWSVDLPQRLRDHCVAIEVDGEDFGDALEKVLAHSEVPRLVETKNPAVRVRMVDIDGGLTLIVFNESGGCAEIAVRGLPDEVVRLGPYGLVVLRSDGECAAVVYRT